MARLRLGAAGLIVAVVLAACGGGGEDPEVTPEATSIPETPTAVATEIPTLGLGAVIWTTSVGANGEPGEPVESFGRNTEEIFAVVEVTNAPPGTSVTAEWAINGSPLPRLAQTVAVPEGVSGGWVSFALTWEAETMWPAGELSIVVTANSGETSEGSVTIG